MTFSTTAARLLASTILVVASLSASLAKAADPIRIGMIAPFSGPLAEYGQRMNNGIRAYIDLHGDTVAGRKVEVITRDTTGPLPDVAKRLAQELLTRDKVDFLVGFGFTPEALAVAPLATQAKKPMLIMNAAASSITTKSPYIARVSFTLAQISAPLGEWAAKNGIKTAYTVVSDYAPGIDAESAFKKAFTAHGGQITDSVRVPLQGPELAPFVQRIKNGKPGAVFVFVPGGEQIIAFMKAFEERGLKADGIKVLLASELPNEVLQAMGEAALSVTVSSQYLESRKSPENAAFRKAYEKVSGGQPPAAYSVAAYDGMAAIYNVAKKLNGKLDGDQAMEVLKGMKLESPRGPITIDPETRDVIQTMHIGAVRRTGNHNAIVEIDKFVDLKDPGKQP
jgi:branched-chain amino acid transport system substrate-binding protein